MNKIKKIAVMTSGGDSQGMNSALRAAIISARKRGLEVIGIYEGYKGLIEGNFVELDEKDVRGISAKGGTFLYSARCLEFKDSEQTRIDAAQRLKDEGIQGLIVVGGDGSFQGAEKLSDLGVPTIGVPGTIDNDIGCTDFTIGFDSACNIVLDNIEILRDTMESHSRAVIFEVMGRDCGDIALFSSIAGGADGVIIPEKFDRNKFKTGAELYKAVKEKVIDRLQEGKKLGKRCQIIIISEGITLLNGRERVIDVHYLASEITKLTGIDTRANVLGHIQRGGSPTLHDRMLASRMGARAVELLAEGIGNRVVSIRGNKVVDDEIHIALDMKNPVYPELYQIAPLIEG